MDHDHLSIVSVDAVQDPAGFMRAFFEHVRDVHGRWQINARTPWQQIVDQHKADHNQGGANAQP